MTYHRHNVALQQAGQGSSMAIGEFGGAPAVPGDSGVLVSTPLYWFYEMSYAALNPSRAWADATRLFFKNPGNPLSYTTFGKSVAAACELFERSTRRYSRPELASQFDLRGRRANSGADFHRMAAAILQSDQFRASIRTSAQTSAAETADSIDTSSSPKYFEFPTAKDRESDESKMWGTAPVNVFSRTLKWYVCSDFPEPTVYL